MDTRTRSEARATSSPLAGARMLHTMLRVHDLEKSLQFYAGLLA